ncbi:MAG: hypothetical protein EHM48_04810, partial [Planctomycetaceae bacterium]
MVQQKLTPGKKWYIVGVGLLLVVSAAFAWGLVGFISTIGSALGQQVVVPGSGEITLAAGGTYNIVHEYQTVVGNEMISNPQNLAGLKITMKDAATGQDVPLRPVSANINISAGSRRGVVLMDFASPAGGKYVLASQYPPGLEGPRTVLSVGSEIGPAVVPFVITLALFVLGMIGAVAIFVIVAVLRARNRRKIACTP